MIPCLYLTQTRAYAHKKVIKKEFQPGFEPRATSASLRQKGRYHLGYLEGQILGEVSLRCKFGLGKESRDKGREADGGQNHRDCWETIERKSGEGTGRTPRNGDTNTHLGKSGVGAQGCPR